MQSLQKKIKKCIFQEEEFLYNVPFLKEFISSDGAKKYKLTLMYKVKNKFVESPGRSISNHNTEKLDNNLQRSRSRIYEYAYCNKWDYFFTGTLDKTKASREDLRDFNKNFGIFISNFNRKYDSKVTFLIIPELHSDMKSWHFHRLYC